MMDERIRSNNHRFSNFKPVFLIVLFSLIMMYGYFFFMSIIDAIATLVQLPFLVYISMEQIEGNAKIAGCICGFLVMFFYYSWYRPEYQWKPRNSALAFCAAAPIIVFWVVLFLVIFPIAEGHSTFGFEQVSVKSIFLTFEAGICEEVAFREIGISYMKRQIRDNKYNPLIIIVTSTVFGAIHLLYILFDGYNKEYLFQAFFATCLGCFLGCIFLRTGNIWPCIAVHSIHDLLSVFCTAKMEMPDYPVYIYIWLIVHESLLALCGLFLIRKKKHPEIKELWDEKWQITEFD